MEDVLLSFPIPLNVSSCFLALVCSLRQLLGVCPLPSTPTFLLSGLYQHLLYLRSSVSQLTSFQPLTALPWLFIVLPSFEMHNGNLLYW